MIGITTAIKKMSALKKRNKVIQGGTWAGKTYGILIILIDKAIKNKGKRITVVSETIPAVKGSLKDFKNILMTTNRWDFNLFNGTDRCYSFTNGSVIEFKAFDDVSKAEAEGKRDILFLNEAPYIAFNIAWSLIGRTSDEVWYDFNPRWSSWIHDEIIPSADTDFIILKPEDNQALPEQIKQIHLEARIKAKTSEYWKNWCRVYLDGEIGSIEGLVFPDIELIDEFPGMKYEYGMDFGWTAPSTLIKTAITDDSIYIHELFYRSQMNEQDFIQELANVKKTDKINADSEDQRMINYLFTKGYNIHSAKKGKGSVEFGIGFLQGKKIHITKQSVSTIKEFRNLMYAKDKEGNIVRGKYEGEDHSIDAVRYTIPETKKTTGFKISY